MLQYFNSIIFIGMTIMKYSIAKVFYNYNIYTYTDLECTVMFINNLNRSRNIIHLFTRKTIYFLTNYVRMQLSLISLSKIFSFSFSFSNNWGCLLYHLGKSCFRTGLNLGIVSDVNTAIIWCCLSSTLALSIKDYRQVKKL